MRPTASRYPVSNGFFPLYFSVAVLIASMYPRLSVRRQLNRIDQGGRIQEEGKGRRSSEWRSGCRRWWWRDCRRRSTHGEEREVVLWHHRRGLLSQPWVSRLVLIKFNVGADQNFRSGRVPDQETGLVFWQAKEVPISRLCKAAPKQVRHAQEAHAHTFRNTQ